MIVNFYIPNGMETSTHTADIKMHQMAPGCSKKPLRGSAYTSDGTVPEGG